jgi:hypothetical protein
MKWQLGRLFDFIPFGLVTPQGGAEDVTPKNVKISVTQSRIRTDDKTLTAIQKSKSHVSIKYSVLYLNIYRRTNERTHNY